jgi:hypothetical protein
VTRLERGTESRYAAARQLDGQASLRRLKPKENLEQEANHKDF